MKCFPRFLSDDPVGLDRQASSLHHWDSSIQGHSDRVSGLGPKLCPQRSQAKELCTEGPKDTQTSYPLDFQYSFKIHFIQ